MRADLSKLIELQRESSQIRNICILAHVDHGKTTLADCLIANNGIISQKLAGKLRYMDSRPDEQERQITMKSSSITLLYNSIKLKEDFLINLIDSPGHVDFSSEVSTAVRLCDGAIIVVDIVEGVCAQTRICLQQAYNENLKTVLFLNKIDRLILEKRLTADEAYKHIKNVLEQVNAVVGNIFATDVIAKQDLTGQSADQISALEDSDDSSLYFAPENRNVIFGSAIDGWGFTLQTFANLLAEKIGISEEKLEKFLFGDYYYAAKKKKIETGAFDKGKKPLFVQFILENIWNLYTIIENKELDKLTNITEKLGIKLLPRDLKYNDPKILIRTVFSQWLPIEQDVLNTVVINVPNPMALPETKAEKLLCPSLENFTLFPPETQKLKNDILKCDSASNNVIVFISKMFCVDKKNLVIKHDHKYNLLESMENMSISADDATEFIAFARVYSGTLKSGAEIYVLGPKHDPRKLETLDVEKSPHISKIRIENLFLLMGRSLEQINEIPAGNIVGIGGLQNYIMKTGTLSNHLHCPPFVDLPIMAKPILRVAVETQNTQDMNKLVAGLKLLNQADPCVQVLVQETGEHVLLTLGEVHLERCITDLEESYAKVKLNVSKPIVQFRETIAVDSEKDKSVDKTITVHTTNKHCSIKIIALPLPEEVVNLLDINTELLKVFSEVDNIKNVSSTSQESMKSIKNKINEIMQQQTTPMFDATTTDRIWSIGPKKCGSNMLINMSDYTHPSFWRTPSDSLANDPRGYFDSSFINGFQLASLAGPLCDEPMQGVAFVITEWIIEDTEELNSISHGPFSGQVMSAVKEGCKKAFQIQSPRLVAPMYSCRITVSSDVLGKLYAVIGRRHGKIVTADLIEGSGQFDVSSIIPVIESFNFAKEIRTQTSGLAMPQLVFSHWEILDIDPFWVPTTEDEYEQYGEKADFENIAKVYMDSIRERKGLYVEKQVVEHAEKQRTLSKNK